MPSLPSSSSSRYVKIEKPGSNLGEGTYGVVYKARDVQVSCNGEEHSTFSP